MGSRKTAPAAQITTTGSAVATGAPAARYMDTAETAPTTAVQGSVVRPTSPPSPSPRQKKCACFACLKNSLWPQIAGTARRTTAVQVSMGLADRPLPATRRAREPSSVAAVVTTAIAAVARITVSFGLSRWAREMSCCANTGCRFGGQLLLWSLRIDVKAGGGWFESSG